MMTLPKKWLAAAAIAGLGLSTMAVAGHWGGYGGCPMGGHGGPMMGGRGGGGSEQRQAMMQQFRAERMELLAARLKLKPEQESVWKTFLAAQDAHHAAMQAIRQAMRDPETTALAHFEERANAMEQRLVSMKTMIKAAGDLYAALDADQKQVMDKFFTDRPMRRGQGRGFGPAAGPGQPAEAPDQPDEDG